MDKDYPGQSPLNFLILLCLCIGSFCVHLISADLGESYLLTGVYPPIAGEAPIDLEDHHDHQDDNLLIPRLRTASSNSGVTTDRAASAIDLQSHLLSPLLPPPKLINPA